MPMLASSPGRNAVRTVHTSNIGAARGVDPGQARRVMNSAEERLRQGYRVIRQVTGQPESPWPGSLICGPGGETAVAVDAAVLGSAWGGWDASGAGHILAPMDILRRPDGHDVLIPVCTERLAAFLTRRGELTAGEGVTVAVSLLRGVGELMDRAETVTGSWWLTESGRPVFATDTAQEGITEQTAELLAQLGRDVPILADPMREAIDALAEPRRRARGLDRAEQHLFAAADPFALATTTFGPRSARPRATSEPDAEMGSSPARASWATALSRHVDAEWADLVSRTTTNVWRALRAPRTGRRRPWLVAGGLGAVIVVGGLMWPAGGSGPVAADAAPAGGVESPSAAPPDPASSPTPTVAAPVGPAPVDPVVDLTSVAVDLLAARTACAADPPCLGDVLEDPGARFPEGVVDLEADHRTVTLLDEFGGAAVLRAEAVEPGPADQLVVLVHAGGRWLLRDVYDAAEQ